MSCLIAVVVLLPVTYCVMIDARQSFFELKSKCFFFWGGGGEGHGWGGGVLAYRFLEAIDYIRSHLSLNINDYRDSASVARH